MNKTDGIIVDFTKLEVYIEKVKGGLSMATRWIEQLSDEDAAFLKRFVLASGSLKDVAAAYGISYPTIRLRLDRLIEKVKLLDSQEISSEFERVLRVQFAEGKVDAEAFRALLAAHHHEMEGASHEDVPTAADNAAVRQPAGR